MKSVTKAIVFALFIGCSIVMFYSPNFASDKGGEKELPPQTKLPEANKPIFVEFYSVTCGICSEIAPVLDALGKEYSDRVEFVRLDTDNPANYELSEMFKVYALPAMHWISSDKVVKDSHEGYISEKDLRAKLDALIAGDSQNKGQASEAPYGS